MVEAVEYVLRWTSLPGEARKLYCMKESNGLTLSEESASILNNFDTRNSANSTSVSPFSAILLSS